MSDQTTILYWIRRDMRVSDNPALSEAVNSGAYVIPVFIYDDRFSQLGAAPKFRLEKSPSQKATAYRIPFADRPTPKPTNIPNSELSR